MTNPFEHFDSRLCNIERLLLEIKHKSESEEKEENLNVDEVAKILLVSKQSVYSYIRKGQIKANKIGRTFLIKREDLEEATKEVQSLKYKRD